MQTFCGLRTRRSWANKFQLGRFNGFLIVTALIGAALLGSASAAASRLPPQRDTCPGAARADSRGVDAKTVTRLCRGAEHDPAPADCLARVLREGEVKAFGRQYLDLPQSVDLCAGTIDASARINCFRQRHLQQNQSVKIAIEGCSQVARAPVTISTEPISYHINNRSGRSLTLVPIGEYQGRTIYRTPVILQPMQRKQIQLVPGTEVQVLQTSDGTGAAPLYSLTVGNWDYLMLTDTEALFD